MSDFAIHPTPRIIDEADSILSRTRAAFGAEKVLQSCRDF
jgi:hypothetical protein